jgi:hypothetical protein
MNKNYKTIKANLGTHFVFSTLPTKNKGNTFDFEKSIETYYFDEYRENLFSKEEIIDSEHLFSPIKFYMLGDYDILYISLINTFNFVHRLFEPIVEGETPFNPHTFQSFSGFLLHKENSLDQIKNIFKTKNQKPISYFVGVINIKLNNGLYIGNGLMYIEEVYNFIERELGELKIEFLLNQTFSWFELSLVVFIDNPNQLSEILSKLSNATLGDLNENSNDENSKVEIINEIIKNCLYKNQKFNDEQIKKTSLFSDTSSHFGFNEILIKESFEDNKNESTKVYIKEFIKKAQDIKLETEIEWQVKPGHINELVKLLKSNQYFGEFFKNENELEIFENSTIKTHKFKTVENNMVLGKCDYLITENRDSILSNFHIVRHLHESRFENCEIFEYARKIRTYLFLEINLEHSYSHSENNLKNSSKDNLINWSNTLVPLAVKPKEFLFFENILRKLKVSRQIRNKILKIFSNYNNGILDPIQFIYFIDFTIFIEKIKSYLIEKLNVFEANKIERIKDIEFELLKYITTFSEAYNVRFLNGYQFENIPDIDLDFNNSIQQLLSAYGLIIHDFGSKFFDDQLSFGPVVQLNNLDTVSNVLSINYAAHLLTSPEFIATTLTKEILNIVVQNTSGNETLEYLKSKNKGVINDLRHEINEEYFDDLLKANMVDFNYFIIDSIRFIITFKGDFKLFEYWFWAYNFQNTSLYDTSGLMNEQHLRQEMFRILLVQKFFKMNLKYYEGQIDTNSLKIVLNCPTPEVHTYWIAHFSKLDKITNKIFDINKVETNYILKLREYIDDVVRKHKEFSFNFKSIENSFFYNISKLKHKTDAILPILLKRNWKDGLVINNYFDYQKQYLTLVDQIGGSYQIYNSNRQLYFDLTSMNLLDIIHYAAVKKRNFIDNLKNLIKIKRLKKRIKLKRLKKINILKE